MPILSYGIYKPSLKDQADVVFPAMEANWQQVNDHNHDGVNSVLISANTLLPSQTGNAGKVLTTNGTNVSWVVPPTAVPELPNQVGEDGKFLTTAAGSPLWAAISQVPDVSGASPNDILTTDGLTYFWAAPPAAPPDELPAQTGNGGKFLTTDGNSPSWVDIPTELPDQTGNGGKILTTDGSTPSWTNVINNLELTGSPVFKNTFISLYGNGGVGGNFAFFHSQGTFLAPTATLSGNQLAFIGARGHDGTSYNAGSKATWTIEASENHTPTANGTRQTFATTENGTTTRKNRLRIENDGAISLFGNTSGALSLKPAAVTTSHTWNLPAANAAGVLTNDGAGNLSWVAGGSGANTSLSNLGTTAINTDLIFGSDGFPPPYPAAVKIKTADTVSPVIFYGTRDLIIETGSTNFGPSGNLTIRTGYARHGGYPSTYSGALLLTTGNGHSIGVSNDGISGPSTLTTGDNILYGTGPTGMTTVKTGSAVWTPTGDTLISTGNSTNAKSGDLIFRTGTGATRGQIKFQGPSNGEGTTGTVGHVWTQTGADGTGAWQAPSGGGIDPNYISVSPSTSNFTTTSGSSYEDSFQFNRDLTITPAGPNEKWEIYFTGTMIVSPNAVGNQLMDVAIMNQALTSVIDGASARFRYYATVANSDVSYKEIPVTLMAKVTLSASTTYRIGHLYGGVGSGNSVFKLGDNTHGAGPARFWAKRVY